MSKFAGGTWQQQYLLPVSLGIADGILNALTLASASVLHGRGLSMTLAVRVGAVAAITSVFTVFVAEYAQFRAELVQAEHELSFTESGRLAASSLGRQVIRDAVAAALAATGASFVGASVPLLIGTAAVGYSWSALVVSVLALGGLGAALATAVGGNRPRWVGSLMVMGVIVAVVGVVLDIT